MELYKFNIIDILKIDIEGSEKEVFDASVNWIDKTGIIMVELHDELKIGCKGSVYFAAKDFKITWRKGETIFFAQQEYAKGGLVNEDTYDQNYDKILKKRGKILSSKTV